MEGCGVLCGSGPAWRMFARAFLTNRYPWALPYASIGRRYTPARGDDVLHHCSVVDMSDMSGT